MEIAVYDERFGRTDTYDLDDTVDMATITDLYGEQITWALAELEPGDLIRFKCKNRVDEE